MIESWLVSASVLAWFATLVSLRRETHYQQWGRATLVLGLGLSTLSFLILLLRFALVQLDMEIVYLYTHRDIPLAFRLSGAWTSREGSLLLWASMQGAVTLWVAKRNAMLDREGRVSIAISALATLALLGALLAVDPFRATPDFLLTAKPDGNGLNPTLQNAFILIHPPLVFLAYALTVAPLSMAWSSMLHGSRNWVDRCLPLTRWNWLIYTVAMSLGGLWAYETLGFGGFWAWDPVEVANFLPWLALSLLLHSQLLLHRNQGNQLVAPLLATLPFLLTIVSTLSTRSGLWVSVHAFTDPTRAFEPDSAQRLLNILQADSSLVFYLQFLFVGLFVSLLLWHRYLAHQENRDPRIGQVLLGTLAMAFLLAPMQALSGWFSLAALGNSLGLALLGSLVLVILAAAWPLLAGKEERMRRRIDTRFFLHLSVLLVSGSLLLTLLFHGVAVNGWSTSFWTNRLPWLTLPLTMALITYGLYQSVNLRVALFVALSAPLLGLVAWLATGDLLWMALFPALGVLGAGFTQLLRFLSPHTTIQHGITLAGALLILLFVSDLPTQLLGIVLPRASQVLLLPLGILAAWKLLGDIQPNLRGPRLRLAGVHTIHLALGLLAVGYVLSTYAATIETGLVTSEGPLQLAGETIILDGGRFEGAGLFANDVYAEFHIEDAGDIDAHFWYEERVGAYIPLPNTLRSLTTHRYVFVERLCTDVDCEDGLGIRTAFEPQAPYTTSQELHAAQVELRVLPGIRLAWTSMVVGALGMMMILRGSKD